MHWWQERAIYQIYPRSFADSDGDGVGDLSGIRAHLDYIASLGVGAIWLSPIFPSPMADFGYDVADYRAVDPLFGSLADLDQLIADCHARDLRVLLDWVLNHTSDQHPWFTASRSSREDPKRDWYVWRDGQAGGGPPNDWQSQFKAVGPAWTFDEHTGQWYLHSYMAEQPDLNWDNPEVEAAMHDVLRFWFDRGVDGFRLDALQQLAKDPLLRDNAGAERRRDQDWQTMPERLRAIRRVADEYDDRVLVGEVYLLDLNRIVDYVRDGDQLHMVHNFAFLNLPWDATAFRKSIDDFVRLAGDETWPAWFMSNHDHQRLASRFGPAQARALIVLLQGLRGTPFVYQGEELTLPDAQIPADRVVDVDGRDPERAPIPWLPPSQAGAGAGFTDGRPWLPLTSAAEELNAASQEKDPHSALALTRAVAAARAGSPALMGGSQEMLGAGPELLAWIRSAGTERMLAVVNFGAAPTRFDWTEPDEDAQLLVSSDPARRPGGVRLSELELHPAEAVLLRLS